jgi:predicted DNA-binding protein
MKTSTPSTYDERICIRIPRSLRDRLNDAVRRSDRPLSDIVRQSLVEHLSPKEPTR